MALDSFHLVEFANGRPVDAAASSLQVDFDGTCWKMGGSIQSWKKRYFVLSGNAIYYYENPQSTIQKGVVVIRSCSYVIHEHEQLKEYKYKDRKEGLRRIVSSMLDKYNGDEFNKNTIVIVGDTYSSDSYKSMRAFAFTPKNSEEKAVWVEALQEVIMRTQLECAIQMKNIKLDRYKFGTNPEQITQDKKFAESYFGKHTGTVIFQDHPFSDYEPEDTVFNNTFKTGDEIYYKFSLPHAIINYPYFDFFHPETVEDPPELSRGAHASYLLVYIFVDHHIQKRPGMPTPGPFTFIKLERKEFIEKQSFTFPFATSDPKGDLDRIEYLNLGLSKMLVSLPPGEHNVKVIVRTMTVPLEKNFNPYKHLRVKPFFGTEPRNVAEGEFTFVSSGDLNFKMPFVMSNEADINPELDVVIKKFFTDYLYNDKEMTLLASSAKTNWEKCTKRKDCKYQLSVCCLFYRDPRNGWNEESIAEITFRMYTNNEPEPPYVFCQVCEEKKVLYSIEEVSEPFLATIPDRCPKSNDE